MHWIDQGWSPQKNSEACELAKTVAAAVSAIASRNLLIQRDFDVDVAIIQGGPVGECMRDVRRAGPRWLGALYPVSLLSWIALRFPATPTATIMGKTKNGHMEKTNPSRRRSFASRCKYGFGDAHAGAWRPHDAVFCRRREEAWFLASKGNAGPNPPGSSPSIKLAVSSHAVRHALSLAARFAARR